MTQVVVISISVLVSLGLMLFLAGVFWLIIRNIDSEPTNKRAYLKQLYQSAKRVLL